MFFYRGYGWWAAMIPLGLVWIASALFPRPSFDIANRDAYWIYGLALVLGGIVVFYFGRRVNGVTGGLFASYASDRPRATHTINRFPMEHVGPVWVVVGLVVLGWWLVHHLG